MKLKKQNTENKSLILEKATLNAATLLDINNIELSQIIGCSDTKISRLRNNKAHGIDPSTKEGELSLLFVRVFRGLDAFLGNSLENEKKWLRANNKAIGKAPIEAMKTVPGLIKVVNYLDAIRGKI